YAPAPNLVRFGYGKVPANGSDRSSTRRPHHHYYYAGMGCRFYDMGTVFISSKGVSAESDTTSSGSSILF
ncbi:MAG: hypothetical protein Q8N20_08230, partial [Eubacteriales bacterium]|nr:hypothetical protein [Eubacteriales bacterium]